ncbi:flagellar biosynthetic protein FliO [Alphaproteobacteria bacterium]|jgi:flagellar biogenesis protein FliO|nr:flagellar biosynthetic protein FliO [Alphaproteobacteria bacterium]
MATDGVSLTQIFTVTAFLGAMILALFYIKRNRDPLTSKLHAGRRVQVVSNTSLGVNETIRIIRIDEQDYVLVSGKNINSHFYALSPTAPHNQNAEPQDDAYSRQARGEDAMEAKPC